MHKHKLLLQCACDCVHVQYDNAPTLPLRFEPTTSRLYNTSLESHYGRFIQIEDLSSHTFNFHQLLNQFGKKIFVRVEKIVLNSKTFVMISTGLKY